ncbi:unnamed protein product [Ilex paraguariensis]|uniref:Core Histone H2A/H2B/H3 domain-containing protein n=1 Tax=Ilex paraguariensis TaxID=185542 RepID=A0ABC8S6J7_9AQUA
MDLNKTIEFSTSSASVPEQDSQMHNFMSMPAAFMSPNNHQQYVKDGEAARNHRFKQLLKQNMQLFWNHRLYEIRSASEFRTHHRLPLARVKKIMKADEGVKMISADTPVLFAKACELFILELTLRSWLHTDENKRRTLQRCDIARAIRNEKLLDFLADAVPLDHKFRTHHRLPLARVKKIMKADEGVKMISADTPVLFAKACELFILELTLRSWLHTDENKRRTLQRCDIARAIRNEKLLDFLADAVPLDHKLLQEEVTRSRSEGNESHHPATRTHLPMANLNSAYIMRNQEISQQFVIQPSEYQAGSKLLQEEVTRSRSEGNESHHPATRTHLPMANLNSAYIMRNQEISQQFVIQPSEYQAGSKGKLFIKP